MKAVARNFLLDPALSGSCVRRKWAVSCKAPTKDHTVAPPRQLFGQGGVLQPGPFGMLTRRVIVLGELPSDGDSSENQNEEQLRPHQRPL